MPIVTINEINLIGLSLKTQTTNSNGQSAIDCGHLWQEFEKGAYATTIPERLTNEVLAVYHRYEGDHTKPFSYFIGCKVKPGTVAPEGLDSLSIPAGNYEQVSVRGKMPNCINDAWLKIWDSGIPRSFQTDFEVYDQRSKDWDNAELDIYLSVQ